MAILDLLRRGRQDEDEDDAEEADGETPDADEETEDDTPGGGLLGRLNRVSRLGRVLRRRGDDDDEGEDDADGDGDGDAGGAEDGLDDEESSGGGFLRRFGSVRGLGGFLRRGNRDEDGEIDDDNDDGELLPVGLATIPETPPEEAEAPEDASPESESEAPELPSNAAGSSDEVPELPEVVVDPVTESLGDSPEDEESELGLETSEPELEMSASALRLRELARTQENVPAEELVDDLQELLDLLVGRHR